MIRVLPFAVELVLVIFCVLDCLRADESRIRSLPRWAWLLIMILIPIVGCVAWLFAGRPTGSAPAQPPRPPSSGLYEQPPRQRVIAPDDDPEFLRSLKRSAEHERLLKQWEDDLKRREDELRKNQGQDPEQL
ncbi:MAG TPA: PLD nuclease N-terminal domain-containing protein [Propionicimonas sp.]|nr:PLD nuclease N-terminal domain-containing protein [Propionicimonas sp.]HQA78280.1 PLD nuclease N-terminal domain-containing protein [Propionicimonas sp.]HQD96399.1 PLD nuclease N-terminal domain-containing protein [Propionicimonas sp.]